MSVTHYQDEEDNPLSETDEKALQALLQPPVGRTLLPGPVASLISTATGLGSLSLKIGTKIGGWWLSGSREATLGGLELARLAIETLLGHAARDVARRSNTQMGKAEAEGVLERAVSGLHKTLSTVSIFAASGFYFASGAMDSGSALGIQGLATLNAILGSTESSRAVAAIITLIRNELSQKESSATEEARAGYIDLFGGTVGFVLLQRWGRRKTELEFRERGGEEVIWDTVIDDKGFRADVVGTRKDYSDRVEKHANAGHAGNPLTFVTSVEDEGDDFEVLERGTLHDTGTLQLSSDDQTRLSDEEIRDRIMAQLPEGARATITSETITAKTIKVDIYGAETAYIEAPPGTVMIAERLNHPVGTPRDESEGRPDQTVIFRTALKRSSSAEIEPLDRIRMTINNTAENDTADEDVVMMRASPVPFEETETAIARSPSSDGLEMEPGNDINSPEAFTPTVPVANQKKSRIPTTKSPSGTKTSTSKVPQVKSVKDRFTSTTKSEKPGPFKKALKSLSPSQSSAAIKDIATVSSKESRRSRGNAHLEEAIPRMTRTKESDLSSKPLPRVPSTRQPNALATQGRMSPIHARSMSKQSATQASFAVHERRRDSIVSTTDSYSVHSVGSRPGSPTSTRTHAQNSSGLTKTKSEMDIAVWGSTDDRQVPEEVRHHQRSKSYIPSRNPSLYSMHTKDSEEAIILAPKIPFPRKSVFEDQAILTALASDGLVPGIFPKEHLVRTIRRFARFASASYGSNFLRVMGLKSPDKNSSASRELMTLDVHHEHSSFSSHTGLPPDTILMSSFYDPEGMTGNTEWSPSAISPLIHFISIDPDSKAVVLTCRGTLGFEDVLTDMTCDFDDLYWQGQPFKVHKGIHASAKRLLGGSGSRVMATIKATLEEYPDFGLVFCGHSLGGAVASLLAILISEPSTDEASGASFVTARTPKLLTRTAHDQTITTSPPISLPAGRRIHVYAYGSPATVSEDLRLATRGLITTVVNHNDVVPSLSLGMLHDFRSVALHLKSDSGDAILKLKSRVWSRIGYAFQSAFYVDPGPPPVENVAGDGLGEDNWAWSALQTLREGMTHDKLVPPGEIFVVETTRVFDRQTYAPTPAVGDTATERVYRSLGRPATRVQFKFIRDVEGRFGEIRFGRSMFSDHSPGRYEASLAALEKGILEG